jgi:GTP-binding protein
VLLVSGVTGKGTDMVLYKVIETLDAEKAARLEAARRKVEPNWAP